MIYLEKGKERRRGRGIGVLILFLLLIFLFRSCQTFGYDSELRTFVG